MVGDGMQRIELTAREIEQAWLFVSAHENEPSADGLYTLEVSSDNGIGQACHIYRNCNPREKENITDYEVW